MKTRLVGLFLGTGLCCFVSLGSPKNAWAVDPTPERPLPSESQEARDSVVTDFVEPKPGQPHHPFRGWYLGVYGSYSDTGLLITQVFPNSPASRAGLEVGDRIVTVDGHQIGVVRFTRLNLDDALQRYGQAGRVRLLVQDTRTRLLVNLDVRIARNQAHF